MKYQDFTIDLRSAGSDRFEATVVAAPIRDTPRIFFSEPIEKKELETLLAAFDRPGSEIKKDRSLEMTSRRLGGQLYSALFQGELGDLFLQCRAAVPLDGRSGLRLRLKFRLGDTEAAYLAALPWEWMWDSKKGEFLATDLGTPVIRDLAIADHVAHRHGSLKVTPPLRILVVDAAPNGLHPLDLQREVERITAKLASLIEAGRVEILQISKVTVEELRDVLRKEGIHVLHFMGHGGYDAPSGFGAVFFFGRGEKQLQVSGEMLATYLKGFPSLRLVVLNACKSARYAGRLGASFNEGVASAILAHARVPAVVANQYSISDSDAITFSEIFYGRIAEGDDVEAALTEVRLRLKGQTPEWATPILFLTARDSKLFSMERAHGKRPTRTDCSTSQPAPVYLGVRSIVGWGGDMEARNDAVLDLTQYFDGRAIKEKPWWQEKVFPMLREFLRARLDERRPLLLDFAAHSSIAFAAGWLLEPKSGLDVRVRQRTGNEGEFEWSPNDGKHPEGILWLERADLEITPDAPDVALALSVSQPDVAEEVQEFIHREGCPIGRIIEAVVAPEPGGRSVLGGAHALRLAHDLFPRLRRRRPHERAGRVHIFCAAPNALTFYLGQLASALPGIVLYEYPFGAKDAYGRYQKSIELPPPGEVKTVPKGW
ncbi:MAG TPA: SAVED domain-containing protein [Thermoanaerobaculia bacterium]|nr:SAVED domain-containing protein [Thermoanaerobaculia bacterium]